MIRTSSLLFAFGLMASSSVAASVGPVQSASDAPADWTVQRVGGDLDAAVSTKRGEYRFGRMRIESALPEGYPAPTPPGAIELKRYPAVRRAEVSGSADPDRGRNNAFWPLFQHIKRREIAMTSPVEMDYRDFSADGEPGSWTMSFLYRTADLGPTGRDGAVTVADAPAVTVISVGVRGRYDMGNYSAGIAALEQWLKDHADEWRRAGDGRAFYYNSPFVREADKWSEVQIPVEAVQAPQNEEE